MAAADRLVWIDCEMTGLDPTTDEIVEIACIVTEADLTELDAGISLVVKPTDAPLAAMDDVVVRMHTESGLLEEIPGGTTLEDAQAQVLAYVQQHVPEARKAPLAGSSVYVDRGFLARYMPDLDAHLHYRLVDMSSVKEIVRRWYPRVYFATPEKTRQPPRAGRHPRVHRRAPLLPRRGVRAAPRARLPHSRRPWARCTSSDHATRDVPLL